MKKTTKLLGIALLVLVLGISSCKKAIIETPQSKEKLVSTSGEPCTDCGPDDPGGEGGPPPPVLYGFFVSGGGTGNDVLINMYEGNGGELDVVYYTPFLVNTVDFKNVFGNTGWSHPNNEIRSVSFQGVPAGLTFVFYDDHNGSLSDDYCVIEIKTAISTSDKYVVSTFEHSYEDAYVKVTYHPYNGLDEKISLYQSY
jgi:hypothetical protein